MRREVLLLRRSAFSLVPVTREEHYLSRMIGQSGDVFPPVTRKEYYLAYMAGDDVPVPVPVTVDEMFLYALCGKSDLIPKPVTRLQMFMANSLGEEYELTPVTREEMYWNEYVGGAVYDTASGPIATFIAKESPVKQLSVAVEPVQSGSGDPSPTNVRPITGWDSVNIWVQPTHDTTAEPTATIQLGETVYGGTLDVVNGKMTVDRAMVKASSLSLWNIGNLNDGTGKYAYASNVFPTVNQSVICDCRRKYAGASSNWEAMTFGEFRNSTTLIVTVPIDVTTRALAVAYFQENDATFVYPLATPFELTLTPEQISTLQGTNNVWSDAGDVTVEYRVR